MHGAPPVAWKTDELVAGSAGQSGRRVEQRHRYGACRVGTGDVWMGASRGQTVESVIVLTVAWGFLQV